MIYCIILTLICQILSQKKAATFVPNIKIDRDVAVLTAINFKEMMKKYESVLVEFYSPNCGRCEEFVEVYSEIGKKYKENNKIGIGKISCSKYPKFTDQFKITHFPTLLYFHKGRVVHEFQGNRNVTTIVEYLEYMDKLINKGITDISEVNYLKSNFTKAVVYYGKDQEVIHRLKNLINNIMFTFCTDDIIIKKEFVPDHSLVLYKESDEKRNSLPLTENKFKDNEVIDFIKKNSKAFYRPFTYQLFLKSFFFKETIVALINNCTTVGNVVCEGQAKLMSLVAKMMYKKYQDGLINKQYIKEYNNLVFTLIDLKNDDLTSYFTKKFHIKNENLPMLVIKSATKHFEYKGDLTPEKICDTFIMNYLNSKLIPKEDL